MLQTKTTADFSTYRALFMGDPVAYGYPTRKDSSYILNYTAPPSEYLAAIYASNYDQWAPAITG
jgi:hypothetical protein